MAIIVPEPVTPNRRDELAFEIAGLIEEAATSEEKVTPDGLASSILDLIEIETGVTFDGPAMSAAAS